MSYIRCITWFMGTEGRGRVSSQAARFVSLGDVRKESRVAGVPLPDIGRVLAKVG